MFIPQNQWVRGLIKQKENDKGWRSSDGVAQEAASVSNNRILDHPLNNPVCELLPYMHSITYHQIKYGYPRNWYNPSRDWGVFSSRNAHLHLDAGPDWYLSRPGALFPSTISTQNLPINLILFWNASLINGINMNLFNSVWKWCWMLATV